MLCRLQSTLLRLVMLSKIINRAVCLAALLFVLSCGGGDDDGRRLGEIIVGTWQRGWGEGDVIIEGETDLTPENFTYDQFVFNDDGSYNGMVRKGTFIAYDTNGNVIIDGSYQCDNHNMRLEPNGEAKMLAQVAFFTDTTLQLKYTFEEYNISVTFIIRKIS